MRSRYDFMTPSKVLDSDGQAFPDPLSIKFGDFTLDSIPEVAKVSIATLRKFWKFMYDKYGLTDFDDLLLAQNNIDYLGNLEPGDNLYLYPVSILPPTKVNYKEEEE